MPTHVLVYAHTYVGVYLQEGEAQDPDEGPAVAVLLVVEAEGRVEHHGPVGEHEVQLFLRDVPTWGGA
jgi:hypothetical protein